MVESTVFIGAVIIALVQIVKYLAPKVTGVVTIVIAVAVGALVGLIDGSIGVTDVTVAQGILIGLSAVGTLTTVQSFGSKTPPKDDVTIS